MLQDVANGFPRHVVFARFSKSDRWELVHGESFQISEKDFRRVFRTRLDVTGISHWAIVWGQEAVHQRKVVSLFSSKWMVYDRYGSFRYDHPLPVVPSAPLAHGVGGTGSEDVVGHVPDSPVPNTKYKADSGDPRTIIPEQDDLVLTPDALRYYEELYEKRKSISDDVKAEAGECDFELGTSLRVTWIPQQRADKALGPMFAPGKTLADGYRIAKDGLLERLVKLPPPANATWVPIVPDGKATGNLSWKRWLFLQVHVGILGHIGMQRKLVSFFRDRFGG